MTARHCVAKSVSDVSRRRAGLVFKGRNIQLRGAIFHGNGIPIDTAVQEFKTRIDPVPAHEYVPHLWNVRCY